MPPSGGTCIKLNSWVSKAIFVFCLFSKMLLHRRSVVLQVYLILLGTAHYVTSQEYDYAAEDDDYSSEYSDDHSHPDYTKYFGGQAAASGQVADKKKVGGFAFIQPSEFESFFNTPITFGEQTKESTAPQPAKKVDPFEALKQSFGVTEAASESNPLQKDYFEESQRKQNAEESAIQPGPHYVSHQIPLPHLLNADDDEDKAQSKDDVETIPPPLKGKHNKKKVKLSPARPGFDGFKDSFDAFETLRKAEEQIEQTKIDPTTQYGGKNVDYNIGKSSSTVSQYPAASGYLSNLKIPTTTLTPYQKYSFQPLDTKYEALQSKYLEALVSTSSPLKNFEQANLNEKEKDDGIVSPSENVPENLKNKACRRIHSPENAENMNCFVCEDGANKAKYTQCSYTSGDEPVNEYAGSSIRYSSPVKAPATFRYKRSPRKGRYSDDPYFQISQASRKYFDDYEKEQKVAESERQKAFEFKPDEPEEYSYSESQSSALLKEPGACQKVDREGMTCTVCRNAKTGGNFEQCSYTSAPKEQKYAYVAEKKYDSEDEPEETKTVIKQSSEDPQKSSSSAQVPQSTAAPAKYSTATKSKIVRDPIPELAVAGTTIDETAEESPESEEDDEEAESEDDEESDDSEEKKEEKESDDGPSYFNYGELKKDKKIVNDDPYDVPAHFSASVNDEKKPEEDGDENFDEYHYKLFPELNKGAESKDDEQRTDATEQQPQDVEEVLAEFAKKDRSNCKKAEKNGMTCFLCVDKNLVQHEECMYVAESKPKPTHIAYHEVQRLKDPKSNHQPLVNEEHSEESRKVETVTQQPLDPVLPLASEKSKKKNFFKKVITTPLPLANLELSAAASNVYETVVPLEMPRQRFARAIRDLQASGSAPDSERLDDSRKKNSDEPEAPKEIDVGDEEGAYSHETKPVYSKLFGTTLPKYMVEKTEFEKEFDAVSGFD